jgi:cell division septation protein DedD
VPYRDEPARELTERVTTLRSLGYPLLGMVALTAAGVDPRPTTGAAAPVAGRELDSPDAAQAAWEGGSMEGEANTTRRGDEELLPDAERRDPYEEDVWSSGDAGEVPADGDERPGDAGPPEEAREEALRGRGWTEAYGPGGPRRDLGGRRRSRLPWWGIVLILLVVAAAGLIGSRLLHLTGGPPELGTDLPRLGSSEHQQAADMPAGEVAVEDADQGLEAPATTGAGEPAAHTPTPRPAAAEGMEQQERPAAPGPEQAATRAGAAAAESPHPPASEGPATGAAATASPSGDFGVLCGSFRELSRATEVVSRLREHGLEAHVTTIQLPGKGTWNRVIAGRWSSKAEARRQAQRALDAGWITAGMVIAADGKGVPIGPALEPRGGN